MRRYLLVCVGWKVIVLEKREAYKLYRQQLLLKVFALPITIIIIIVIVVMTTSIDVIVM